MSISFTLCILVSRPNFAEFQVEIDIDLFFLDPSSLNVAVVSFATALKASWQNAVSLFDVEYRSIETNLRNDLHHALPSLGLIVLTADVLPIAYY